jgi:Ti-type conjugative transfer relaxase TraA
MLSINSISASSAGAIADYYENLSGKGKDDYYENGKEAAGYWIGGGAEKLGLDGDVKEGELLKMLQGFNPESGEALSKNAGDTHKPGWDLTYSAPKSVSAVWAVSSDEMRSKIEDVLKSATENQVKYLEENATFTRHGKGGEVKVPTANSGGLVAAVYQHSTNRNQEPQLHHHVLVANMTSDGRGIDVETQHKMSSGALWRVDVAKGLSDLGFQIEKDGKSFKVAGVPEKLTDEWSSRRREIEADMQKRGVTGAKEAEKSTLETRKAKVSVDRNELNNRWKTDAAKHDFTKESVDKIRSKDFKRDLQNENKLENKTFKGVEDMVKDMTEKNSTFTRLQLLHAVAIDMQGVHNADQSNTVSAEDVMKRVDIVLNSESIVELGTITRKEVEGTDLKSGERYTTKEMLALESKMVKDAKSHSEKSTFAVDSKRVDKIAEKAGLSTQQTSALKHLTDNKNMATVEGWAGTGKSYLLNSAREAWEKEGYKVVGAALANAAANNLESEAHIKSTSIARLNLDIENGKFSLDNKTVLVIDEAGMIGSRQMSDLIDKVQESGAKLVLVGDSKQLQSIEAGGAFKAISNEIGGVELNEVRRQTHAIDKEIAKDFRDGKAGDALRKLDEKGSLRVGQDMTEAKSQAVAGYLADKAAGKETLLIAGTRAEIRDLNREVRTALKESGAIEKVGIDAKTESGYRNFSKGDEIIFGAKSYFGTKEDKSRTVVNGSKAKVESVKDHGDGRVEMNVKLAHSNQVVTVKFGQFDSKVDHSYATTVYKAQGATVDTTHVLSSDNNSKELAYVAASRARENTNIYTSKDHYSREKDKDGKDIKSELEKSMSTSVAKDISTAYKAPIQTQKVPHVQSDKRELLNTTIEKEAKALREAVKTATLSSVKDAKAEKMDHDIIKSANDAVANLMIDREDRDYDFSR